MTSCLPSSYLDMRRRTIKQQLKALEKQKSAIEEDRNALTMELSEVERLLNEPRALSETVDIARVCR